jgi:hypothetical protein
VIVCGPSVEPMIAEPKSKFEGATTAHPVLSKTLTVLLPCVATATSRGPSPFRSVTAIFIGPHSRSDGNLSAVRQNASSTRSTDLDEIPAMLMS